MATGLLDKNFDSTENNTKPTTMNIKNLIGTAFGICLAINAQGLNLITDDFNGSVINSSVWQTATPFSNSSITESGGDAIFANRGLLISQASFSQALDIRGRFEFTGNSSDNFVLTVRTDGTLDLPWPGAFKNGISIVFRQSNDGDPGNIAITDYSNWSRLGYASYSFTPNIYTDFRIVDDGLNITGYVNDLTTPLFSVATTGDYGDKLGLFNREYSGSSPNIVKLDYLTVTAVPEPGTLAILALGYIALGCFNKAKKLS